MKIDFCLLHRLRTERALRAQEGLRHRVPGDGGLLSLTGERGGAPVKPGLPVADLTSGLWVAVAILAALAGRARTGKGCQVDFSMLDGQVALLTLAAARYFALARSLRAWDRASRPRSIGDLSLQGWQICPRHRQRPALGAAVQGARPRRLGLGLPRKQYPCRKTRRDHAGSHGKNFAAQSSRSPENS